MKQLCIVALVSLFAGCGWSTVGAVKVAEGAAHEGKIVAIGGDTYAAFSDGANDGKLTVMKASGGSWAPVGQRGFSPSSVSDSEFALASDGSTLYVAFSSANGFTVMKLAGGSWSIVGAEVNATGSGTLRLAFAGSKLWATNGASHTWSFDSSWTEQSNGLPSTVYSLVFAGAADGTLWAAFNDLARNKLAVCKFVSGTWTEVATSDVTIGEDFDPSIAVNGSDVFVMFGHSEYGAVVLKLKGTTLESVGALGSIANGDSIEYVSGALSNGVPYVAFDDEARDSDPEPKAATVKFWNGSAWELYAGYPNACDIENTYLTTSGGKLFLTYSDCDGDMTVQVH